MVERRSVSLDMEVVSEPREVEIPGLELPTLSYDDLAVGARFRSTGRTITEGDVTAFAGLSGDYNLLHTDAEYCRNTSFGQRIAHGLLVLSVTSGLTARLSLMKAMEPSILGLVDLQCSWTHPTFIGDTIHVIATITELTPSRRPDRGIVVLDRAAVNQRGEEVMNSRWKLLVRRRQEAGAAK
ncbi:MAG: MaoC/PaaZ C-terminal domain-containing protein [Hyphomicrobiales bacterium]